MTATTLTRADSAVATLTPGYFALVMATGILSVGTELTGHHILSMVLLWACIAALVFLLGLTIVRTIRHRGELVSDFLDPARAFGFFTYVAGTNVLGTRLAVAGYTTITLVFLEVWPVEPNPPYWVSMGALAITALAGDRIVEMDSAPMVDATFGLVAGLSGVVWAFATWLIPVLFVVGSWRH